MTERTAFGLEMRRVRERRGLTLEQISNQTKVSVAHFAALEAGDLSRWPSGIFRRAFIRSYATAVGLDPDQVFVEFSRIFPDPADGPRAAARLEAAAREDALAVPEDGLEPVPERPVLRLALDPPRPERALDWLKAGGPRLVAGAIDVALALVPATLVAAILGRAWFFVAAACVGFAGHIVYYAAVGSTPGSRLLSRLGRRAGPEAALLAAQRRSDGEPLPGSRRYVPRHPANRPAAHAHRVRH